MFIVLILIQISEVSILSLDNTILNVSLGERLVFVALLVLVHLYFDLGLKP